MEKVEKLFEPKCYKRSCIHYLGIKNAGDEVTGRLYCKAFPYKIPDRITYGEDKHLVKAKDQENDIVFEKRETTSVFYKRKIE